jgi:hypothetical protein
MEICQAEPQSETSSVSLFTDERLPADTKGKRIAVLSGEEAEFHYQTIDQLFHGNDLFDPKSILSGKGKSALELSLPCLPERGCNAVGAFGHVAVLDAMKEAFKRPPFSLTGFVQK